MVEARRAPRSAGARLALLSFLLMIFLVASAGTAGADRAELDDAPGDVSRVGWDIERIRFSHKDGKLVHALRIHGTWDPTDLERGGRASVRFVFSPQGAAGWRYAVQVLWDPKKEKLVGAFLDLKDEESVQDEVRVRRTSTGLKTTFGKWMLDRPRSYAMAASTAVQASKNRCEEGFADGLCRDVVGYSGNFIHEL